MTATPQDIQAKLDTAVASLGKTGSGYTTMVKKYGADWTKWPTASNWYTALNAIRVARSEAGALVTSSPPTAAFVFKEN